jgi:mono/diheme cytochrome c family protein
MIKKVLLGTGAVIVLGVAALFITINVRWDRRFEAPYPALVAGTDSAVIARGRYLAYGPAHCAGCHVAPDADAALREGAFPPLSGGRTFDIPPGVFRVPNLTPDAETGIGRRTDGELARMLRYGVRADGRAAVPFMEFQGLSDADIVALLSFLRSQAPVSNAVPDHDLTTLGKAVLSFMIKPVSPATQPPAVSPSGPTLETGDYLVSAVAACAGCHSERSMVDGHFTGPRLAGGTPMELEGASGGTVAPPNLTPDPRTGRIATWTEQDFVERFRAGERVPGSPMPWRMFARMSDDDLRAIYMYLHSVPPVEHEPGAPAK